MLQPITDEHLVNRTANREDGTRLDVAEDGFGVMIDNAHFSTLGLLTLTC